MLALGLRGALDRLAIGHARRLELDLDAEAPLHALDRDLDVHLAHAADDHLAGLVVVVHLEHRVLFAEAAQGRDDLVLLALALGGDGEAHERRGEVDGREADDLGVGAQRVARHDVLELGDGADVAGDEAVGGLALLAHRLEHLAEALLQAAAGDDHVGVAAERALEDAEHVDVAAERVGERLEDEGDRGLRGVAVELDLGLAAERPGRRRVGGRRRQGEHVEDVVHGDIGRGGRAGDRVELGGGDGGGERRVELLRRDLLFHQVLLGEIVVGARDRVDELVAGGRGGVGEVRGDVAHRRRPALVRVRLHREQVDDADELVLLADRQLHGDDLGAEGLLEEAEGVVEVGALTVEHVADDDAAQSAGGRAVPEPLVLDLDAEHGVDDDQRGLDDPQGGDRVGLEARVAGRVDEVEGEAAAVDVRQTGREAHLAFLLVVVPVGDRGAVGD